MPIHTWTHVRLSKWWGELLKGATPWEVISSEICHSWIFKWNIEVTVSDHNRITWNFSIFRISISVVISWERVLERCFTVESPWKIPLAMILPLVEQSDQGHRQGQEVSQSSPMSPWSWFWFLIRSVLMQGLVMTSRKWKIGLWWVIDF